MSPSRRWMAGRWMSDFSSERLASSCHRPFIPRLDGTSSPTCGQSSVVTSCTRVALSCTFVIPPKTSQLANSMHWPTGCTAPRRTRTGSASSVSDQPVGYFVSWWNWRQRRTLVPLGPGRARCPHRAERMAGRWMSDFSSERLASSCHRPSIRTARRDVEPYLRSIVSRSKLHQSRALVKLPVPAGPSVRQSRLRFLHMPRGPLCYNDRR